MNKKELVDLVAKKTGRTQKDTAELVDVFVETLKESVVKEGVVKIAGLGAFEVTERAGRDGRNPQTGEALYIKPSKAIKFKTSSTFKALVKGE